MLSLRQASEAEFIKLLISKGKEERVMTNRVKELRKENHITQQQLASMLGVTPRTVISLEKGDYNPSVLLAYKISEVFNVYIEDVFLFDENDFKMPE